MSYVALYLQYSIISVKNARSHELATAKAYYSNVEFAQQLCREFADAERGNHGLSEALENACKTLERIVVHNVLLKSSECQPAWPRHEALLRFDLPLQRLTTHLAVNKKWFPRFFCMRGCRLYYSDGKNGYPDTQDGTLAFMRSNPAPDGRYCVDLEGMHALLMHAAQHGVTLFHRLLCCCPQRTLGRTGICI